MRTKIENYFLRKLRINDNSLLKLRFIQFPQIVENPQVNFVKPQSTRQVTAKDFCMRQLGAPEIKSTSTWYPFCYYQGTSDLTSTTSTLTRFSREKLGIDFDRAVQPLDLSSDVWYEKLGVLIILFEGSWSDCYWKHDIQILPRAVWLAKTRNSGFTCL